MTPTEYLRWLDRFFSTDAPVEYVSNKIGFDQRQDAHDIVHAAYLALRTTVNRRVDSGRDFWMTTDDEAARYTLRALRNTMLGHVRGVRTGEISVDLDEGAFPALLSLPTVNLGPLPDDPQLVLDRIAGAVRDAVATDDLGACPKCGRGTVMELCLAIVESSRDELDPPEEPAAATSMSPGAIARTDATASSIYRAIARARGDEYVFASDDRIDDRAKALLHRCRPCVVRIIDDVTQWVTDAPADWSTSRGQGPR